MTERSEPTARADVQHLTFAEAAERLHITPNAVRMRVHRGSLASVRVDERTFVVWPQSDHVHEPHAARTRAERTDERTSVQGDARLIETLQSEVAYLRSTLDAEIESRRRADHLVAGLMERLPELTAGDDAPSAAPEPPGATEPPRPASDMLMLRWRRWWRRLTGVA